MQTIRILGLGAGWQSSTLYLLSTDNDPRVPRYDYAIMADPGEEAAGTYRHVEWLKTQDGPPILVRKLTTRLGDDLVAGRNAAGDQRKGGRFASIPAFTAVDHRDRISLPIAGQAPRGVGKVDVGRTPRQCTRDYKIDVVEQTIRREILKLRPRQRLPKDVLIEQHFGISCDERKRADKIRRRFAESRIGTCHFPLLDMDGPGWTRDDCGLYLARRAPHAVPRSACHFCPYREYTEWLRLKQTDPAGWARAVEIDRALRDLTSRAAQGLRESLYLLRCALPLEEVDLEALAAEEQRKKALRAEQPSLWDACEDGMCGL